MSTPLTAAQFIAQANVADTVTALQRLGSSKHYSDVTDAAGRYQYVDLVMEGGGMLGIALVGYVYGLEQAGIRFLRLGGTSAGAINAMLMAATPAGQSATEWILPELASKNFYEFVDGDSDAKDFIETALGRTTEDPDRREGWFKRKTAAIRLASKGVQVIDNLREEQGLNPGATFTSWLTGLLRKQGINSVRDLRQRRAEAHQGLVRRDGKPYTSDGLSSAELEALYEVAIIATDLTTQTKAILPRMAHLYWPDAGALNPAELVRASMAVPFFFQPYVVRQVPLAGQHPHPDWFKLTEDEQQTRRSQNPGLADWSATTYSGPIPAEVCFTDGGMVSNFPIDLFHDHHHVPAAPTFGVKLGFDKNAPQKTDSLTSFVLALFDTARTQYDFDFIAKNPDYKQLVHCLDVRGFNWLDFGMAREKQLEMFAMGVRGARVFLEDFNWEAYKQLRAHKAHMRDFVERESRLKNPSEDPGAAINIVANS